ncbi:hypothetical protein [Bradyrhizobium elkanii]|uniref:hypothetical protein n=1 Tax=Bradyrhizobium elkanii TaxID=29448 RepID=UPI0004B832D8|nr:hypothetical protein [Bradyrhizobium elkanii]
MAIVNITVENDADFNRAFIYQTVSGAPIDLTGNTLRMGVRKHAEDVAEQLLLTTENGGLAIINGVAGQFMVRITQAQLVRLPVGDYDQSLVRIFSGGSQKQRIWSGALVNNAGASR